MPVQHQSLAPDDGEGLDAKHDKAVFGENFIWPYKRYPLAQNIEIAKWLSKGPNSREVVVSLRALPARYYTISSPAVDDPDFGQAEMKLETGCGADMAAFACEIAAAIHEGMLASPIPLP